MKALKRTFLAVFLICLTSPANASVGFTQQDLELVKGACLAGDSFEFTTEADGSISVKNLAGKGRLHVTKKNVDTVDLPDSDKKQEFTEIRSCIRDYLSMEQSNRGEQGNRVNQSGDNNENNQINRGGQSNEAIQTGSGNKSSQTNE